MSDAAPTDLPPGADGGPAPPAAPRRYWVPGLAVYLAFFVGTSAAVLRDDPARGGEETPAPGLASAPETTFGTESDAPPEAPAVEHAHAEAAPPERDDVAPNDPVRPAVVPPSAAMPAAPTPVAGLVMPPPQAAPTAPTTEDAPIATNPPAGPTDEGEVVPAPRARELAKLLSEVLARVQAAGREPGAVTTAVAEQRIQLAGLDPLLRRFRGEARPPEAAAAAERFARLADQARGKLSRALSEGSQAARVALDRPSDLDDPFAHTRTLLAQAAAAVRAAETAAGEVP